MAYHFTILFPFVSTLLHSTLATGHTARSKALTLLLQGLLVFKHASLSGMGRGIATIYEEKSFRSQLKKAHRLLKNDKGVALFRRRSFDDLQVWRRVGTLCVARLGDRAQT